MHNIKDLRKNFENFKNLLKNRNVELDLDLILKLDEKNRDLIEKKESLLFFLFVESFSSVFSIIRNYILYLRKIDLFLK